MEDCIFCRIAAGEIPSNTLYEDDAVRAILDLGPSGRGHALVLPKAHFADATEAPAELLGRMMAVGAKIGKAQMKAFGCEGFNLLQNNGTAAGQSVFHLHLHVVPRRTGDSALGFWTPGETTAEERAETEALIKAAFEE